MSTEHCLIRLLCTDFCHVNIISLREMSTHYGLLAIIADTEAHGPMSLTEEMTSKAEKVQLLRALFYRNSNDSSRNIFSRPSMWSPIVSYPRT